MTREQSLNVPEHNGSKSAPARYGVGPPQVSAAWLADQRDLRLSSVRLGWSNPSLSHVDTKPTTEEHGNGHCGQSPDMEKLITVEPEVMISGVSAKRQAPRKK